MALAAEAEAGAWSWIEEGKREFDRLTWRGLERAILCFQKELDSHPASADAHAWLARCYGHLSLLYQAEGKKGEELLDRGMFHARRSYELSPGSSASYLALAELFCLKSDFPAARKMAEAALRIDPESGWAAYLLWKASQGEDPESPHLQQAVRKGVGPALLDQGDLYRRQGEWEKAAASYRGATQQDPPLARGHFALASLREEMGDREGAIREYQQG